MILELARLAALELERRRTAVLWGVFCAAAAVVGPFVYFLAPPRRRKGPPCRP